MTTERYIREHTASLAGKTVAVTGTTGGLGRHLCRDLAALGADLILVDRNAARSEAFRAELEAAHPEVSVRCVTADLSDMDSVRTATETLIGAGVDIFIHNAGAYSIPRKTCDTGFDNVFQINFASPYYMIRRLLPSLAARRGRVVVVGSIAHRYSETDPADVDFATRKQASKVYGNAKRYLMFAMYALARKTPEVSFSVTHPGIAFTGITAHYPKLVFAVIKHPMKVIFMKPKRACLSILRGVFESCGDAEWIGPRVFDVWGLPKKKRLRSCSPAERARIEAAAERVYETLLK